MAPTVAPYGSWKSPITAELIARGAVRLEEPEVTASGVYWLEQRPAEGGRYVICRSSGGEVSDVTPAGFNVRTRVHEYGGGAYVVGDGVVFFCNFDDQRIYRQEEGGDPEAITPEPSAPGALRYADGRLTPDGRLIVCVRESHEGEGEAVNELVVLPVDGSAAPRMIVSGSDFYAFPRVSADGSRLCWTSWDHPRMPWDGTELWEAELSSDGEVGERRLVAGGPEESVFQPTWGPDGALYFVSDRTGWWNLYRHADAGEEPLAPVEAEFGVPQWVFGLATYAFLGDGRIACTWSKDGTQRLGLLPADGGAVEELDVSHRPDEFPTLRAHGNRLTYVGSSPTAVAGIVSLDIDTGEVEVLARSMEEDIPRGLVSVPRAIDFPTEGGEVSHALFYAPVNERYEGAADERPPLIVISHGGPTGQAGAELDPKIQFWTSRGFAVVDVNYRGSSGYGREYRNSLRGEWGVADTADCLTAARHLVGIGEADGERLCIRGGSAGGYTTLCALAFHDLFAAGASYYGVADTETLDEDTHKFESRYLEGLIGPYPETADLWKERSPIHAVDQISCPVILFQGLEDLVVPPSQAEVMAAALEKNGIPYAYLAFEGEQHGFRREETIRRTLEAELYFYGRILGFDPADEFEPVEIHNL
jgi:dipeptidyl aminopeptidase/acylaminoacyl peptidase